MDNSSKKTKVLFVITKSNWGGAQRYVYDLATGLPKDRFDVVVALGGSGTLIHKLHAEHIRVLPIFSLARDVSTIGDIFAFFEIWSIFRREKPDVIHLNSAKASGLGTLAARFAGISNIIFTAHGWAFNEDRSFLSRLSIKLLSWVTTLLAHKTIAVSEAVHKDTRNWPFVKNKIITIHNGVNSVDFALRDDARVYFATKSGITLPHDALLIGTIAELHKNKGLTFSVEAFAEIAQKYPSLFYFILGDGEEREQLEILIKRHELAGRVFLIGFIENAANYLKAFDIFVLPSVKEGLPYVLLEAGIAGLAVVASHVGGIPEIIEDGKTGLLIPPRSPDDIVEHIVRLAKTPSIRASLGTALREKVLRDFSHETMTSRTVALYKKI